MEGWLARARGLAAIALALPLGASAETPASDPAGAERGRLTGVWLFDSDLVIENLTTKRRAHSVRTFPDGSFDGLGALAGGENLLEIRAVANDGHGS